MARFVARLRQLSVDELRVRGGQRVFALLDRYALLPGAWSVPVHDVALERPPGAFLPSLADPRATAARWLSEAPRAAGRVLARSERILAGRFDLLGYTALDFGAPIDWHSEPIAGRQAPREHWSAVPYLDQRVVGDHKVIWELNRHQWFVSLALSELLRRDGECARAVHRHAESWLDANPPGMGINWASALEVGLRAQSWLWTLCLLDAAKAGPPAALRKRWHESLWLHGRHVRRFLSTYFSPNTHLTGEALSLVLLGTACPTWPDASEWRRHGEAILARELLRQIRTDGGYFENASVYHRYTVDFFAQWLLCRPLKGAETGESDVRFRALVRQLFALLHPDGSLASIGDDDGGTAWWFGDRVDDARPSAMVGARLAGMLLPDGWVTVENGAAAWLSGAPVRAAAEAAPEKCASFEESGLVSVRTSWAPHGDVIIAHAGPAAAMRGGHAHADQMHVELSVAGVRVFGDRGTLAYVHAQRDAYRQSAAHNVVVLDESLEDRPAGPFAWESSSAACAFPVHSVGAYTLFTTRRAPWPTRVGMAQHLRMVLMVQSGWWIVHDLVTAPAPVSATLRWHLAPGVSWEAGSPGRLRTGPLELSMRIDGAAPLRDEAIEVSPAYGCRVPGVLLAADAGGDALALTTVVGHADRLATMEETPEGRLYCLPDASGEVSITVVLPPAAAVDPAIVIREKTGPVGAAARQWRLSNTMLTGQSRSGGA